MKRYELKYINNLYDFLDNNNILITGVDFANSKQVRSCQAWAIPCEVVDKNGEYKGYLLQSYYTIVGLKYKGMLFTWKNYSKTTSRQLTWFNRDFKEY